jgi:hypothetical protein
MEVSAMEEALPKATARRKGGLRSQNYSLHHL